MHDIVIESFLFLTIPCYRQYMLKVGFIRFLMNKVILDKIRNLINISKNNR